MKRERSRIRYAVRLSGYIKGFGFRLFLATLCNMAFMKKETYRSFDDLPLMLSVPEVASVLGISRAGAYELVKDKGFPSLTIGSRILIPRDKLIAWIDEKSSGSAE